MSMTDARSVRSVSRDRWQQAQAWERDFWRGAQTKHGWRRLAWPVLRPLLKAAGWRRAWGDDWNHWWAQQFDGYRFLPDALGDCIELGCGPYTNVRLILQGRTARRVVCSDPLADTYLTFRDRWLATAHREGRIEVDAHPIEELPFDPGSFDLVVLNNVLDHVCDADRCLERATGLLRPGGIFIFGQDLSNAEDARNDWHDVGHPIRLAREDVDPHLEGFDVVLRRDLPREAGRDPRLHYATLIFAGRKR